MFRRVFLAMAAVVAFVALAAPATYGQGPPPDSDGDGVYDQSDYCPTQPGPNSPDGGPPGCPRPAAQPCHVTSPYDPNCPTGDVDSDGINNSNDACPAEATAAGSGKPGCPKPYWYGGAKGYIPYIHEASEFELHSGCRPGPCTTTLTLTASKKVRKALGLDSRVVGRKTKTQEADKRGNLAFEFFHFHFSRKVAQKMDRLEDFTLKAKFEVTAKDSAQMQAWSFTETGTVHFDRRPTRKHTPEGQGLELSHGATPPDPGSGDCGDNPECDDR